MHGVVIDLGPGSGNQLARFDTRRIAHVYGVEPNTAFANEAFAERLRRTDIGAEGKYTLVPCGIEDAAEVLERRYGVREGEVDCVLSMQVMVSGPLFLILVWCFGRTGGVPCGLDVSCE